MKKILILCLLFCSCNNTEQKPIIEQHIKCKQEKFDSLYHLAESHYDSTVTLSKMLPFSYNKDSIYKLELYHRDCIVHLKYLASQL